MPEKPVPLTSEGLAKLKEELEHLRTVRRHEVADKFHLTKENVSTPYDAEYDDVKNEQAFVEGRIRTLEEMLRNAVLIDTEQAHHARRIQIGAHVRVTTDAGVERTYVIVGAAEADPAKGWISNESPVGRALLGKQAGDKVEVVAPSGVVHLRVEAID
jgi:transcription elongation factor GreA